MRNTEIIRDTAETKIKLFLELDGTGKSTIQTGVGFLDHMLTLFARHGRFDLDVFCDGDVQVDAHHTTEDIGIVLGQAFATCLGDMRGINRYGFFILPMDEALITTAIDFSGRPHLNYAVTLPTQKVGDFDTELAKEFWLGFVRAARCTLHMEVKYGENSHHILEGGFKCAARSIAQAVAIDSRFSNEIPSTKGIL